MSSCNVVSAEGGARAPRRSVQARAGAAPEQGSAARGGRACPSTSTNLGVFLMQSHSLVRRSIVLGTRRLLGVGTLAFVGVGVIFAASAEEAQSSDVADRGAAGALVDVSLDSRVGVVLDEIPQAQRAAAASYYLAKGNQFWKDRAIAQVLHTTYRLTYRNFFYDEDPPKGILAMPPRELWRIDLAPGGAKRVTTEDGHDAIVINYQLKSTLLSDRTTPGVA